MERKKTRQQIVEAADLLIYEQGYAYTSFADIAKTVQISRGNFYYHFKTKDEILAAVITERLARTKNMLKQWERDGAHPADRIRSFIHILRVNQSKIMRHGCPVGTLCTELAKLNHAAQTDANKLFTVFRTWLRRQFTLLGCKTDADALALHLLARSQGVATLANALHNKAFVEKEIALMCDWLNARIAEITPNKSDHKGTP